MAKKTTNAVKKTTVKSTKKTAPKSTTDETKTILLETMKIYGAKIKKEIIKYGYTLNAPDESGKSLQHEMQNNKDVKFIWDEFEKASDALKADKEIVMAVLAQVGFNYNNASPLCLTAASTISLSAFNSFAAYSKAFPY